MYLSFFLLFSYSCLRVLIKNITPKHSRWEESADDEKEEKKHKNLTKIQTFSASDTISCVKGDKHISLIQLALKI